MTCKIGSTFPKCFENTCTECFSKAVLEYQMNKILKISLKIAFQNTLEFAFVCFITIGNKAQNDRSTFRLHCISVNYLQLSMMSSLNK